MAIKVAVIGAGAAGLASARRLKENPQISFVVFEQTDSVGGTWVYDERTGTDEYGLPIHTSMYKSLRTNLPKEVMGYPDYPITKPADRSYIPAADILTFLKEFTEAFGLNHHIKAQQAVGSLPCQYLLGQCRRGLMTQFRHVVRDISPKESGKGWVVTVEYLPEKKTTIMDFDAVMICNGHYETPNIPIIPGQETFTGLQMHSHDYRIPESFRGMKVVVIGAGPSGLDIGLDLTHCAEIVYLSHHSSEQIDTCFPKNFTFKPDVKEVYDNKVVFVDESVVEADCILYCTGYQYTFPFLSDKSGVKVQQNYVHPLYKHVIAIEHPTMAFIGLPFYVCAFSMFDLQARFFIASLTGKFQLPSREEMLEDEQKDVKRRREKGFGYKDFHKMGPLQVEYYDDLSKTAQIEGLPHVLTKLHNESSRRFLEDLINFRKDNYIILDDSNFQELK